MLHFDYNGLKLAIDNFLLNVSSKYIWHSVTAKENYHHLCFDWFPVNLASTMLFMLLPGCVYHEKRRFDLHN